MAVGVGMTVVVVVRQAPGEDVQVIGQTLGEVMVQRRSEEGGQHDEEG